MKSYNLDVFLALTQQDGFSDYERLLDRLLDVLDAERGCMWFADSRETLYCGDQSLRATFPFSRSIFDRVLEHGNGFVTFDPATDDRIEPTSSMTIHNVRSALAAAGKTSQGEVWIVSYFDNRMTAPPFSESDLKFLQTVLNSLPPPNDGEQNPA